MEEMKRTASWVYFSAAGGMLNPARLNVNDLIPEVGLLGSMTEHRTDVLSQIADGKAE